MKVSSERADAQVVMKENSEEICFLLGEKQAVRFQK